MWKHQRYYDARIAQSFNSIKGTISHDYFQSLTLVIYQLVVASGGSYSAANK